MNHQDIAQLMLLCMALFSLAVLWWGCRPVWTVRFQGQIDSVQFRAYSASGMRCKAQAYMYKHGLGSFKWKRGY